MSDSPTEGIAIIGMAGRFPGAANVEEFWRNLVAGTESISTFTDEELAASGLDVAALRSDPSFVAARGVVDGVEMFDAPFFSMTAMEAAVTDPQQRLFLEASSELLEKAGYDPEKFDGLIGVYAGMAGGSYYLNNLHGRRDLSNVVGERIISLGNDKDYLATRVAYKLNLKGPALNINTACSTALVTVCQACQELVTFQCDIALAGGVSLTFPQKGGVHYNEGGVFSPDGHCRPFDAQAQGTVSSDAVAVVLLKRLPEAIADGDQILAVIKGFGRNNDGSAKVGFTAPSVDGQAEAIVTAQAQAGFDPATISYVEAHGTATPLGDPIEISALTQAFRLGTEERNFCAIGSVKGNIGHTNTAAGGAGLIKTVLALQHQQLPPSVNFAKQNPKIDFGDSPFFVNTKLTPWKSDGPRRAGVSSFGLGGTNAHVVLEEAPKVESSGPSRDQQLFLFSAKSDVALDTAAANFSAYLIANPQASLADAAYTLQVGRRTFSHRRILVAQNHADAIQALTKRDPKRLLSYVRDDNSAAPSVVFMFTGQGSQYVSMGADLYRTEPIFKEQIDRCAEILRPALGLDLRDILYPTPEKAAAAEELLAQTRITQPALFAIEYALATLWMSWGIKPAALTGHSLGEYVAACLAGVFTLEDALNLVAQRGKLIQEMPAGSMLAVPMSEDELKKVLPATLSIAGVNGPAQCVVSGPTADIEAFVAKLAADEKTSRPLHTSHAFHSAMMDPVLKPFAECVARVKRSEPTLPFLSNLTGTWISAAEARDPQYWARHLRQGVRFADGVKELLKNEAAVFLEVGPGTTLGSLVKFQAKKADNRAILSSLRHARETQPDLTCMLTAAGQLWQRGATVDWTTFYSCEKRHRVELPTYPFQRERYWIEPKTQTPATSSTPAPVAPKTDFAQHARPAVASAFIAPANESEQVLAGIWQELLGIQEVGVDDNFFDLGGDSLLLMRVQVKIRQVFDAELTSAEMFQYPTVSTLAHRLSAYTIKPTAKAGTGTSDLSTTTCTVPGECSPEQTQPAPRRAVAEPPHTTTSVETHDIAIIGMAGRFPGADNVDEYWRNLVAGVESFSTFTDEELAASGLDVAKIRGNPSYVPSRGVLENADCFDASFFNIGTREAEITDPQQRIFLEAAWEALENAGYDPSRVKAPVGVFAGTGTNSYYINNLVANTELIEQVGKIAITVGNEKDYVATRTAYKLNLKGPAISTNTACSTSLVTVCLATQSLLARQCDLALAGGVYVSFPQKRANYFQEGGIFSPDGRCRPFNADAAGTTFSDGLGIVVLKRMADAVRDGDQIYAVIKGVGFNNDGSDKVGFTAPSVQGQAEVVAMAQANAGVSPESISYVEAHGTATPLGDPIEIAALTQAFRAGTEKKNFCAIGSVKGNIGHLDAAAGVAGLIKTSLALKNGKLPATVNFTAPNPKIDFANSPFFVNAKLTDWKAGPTPRRAGVSAFGIGGTNAHVVLEEPPAALPAAPSRDAHLLVFSAKTASALEVTTARFVAHLKANPETNLADAAYTLQIGRRVFGNRRMLVARNVADAIRALESLDPQRVITRLADTKNIPVVSMFPAQGAPGANVDVTSQGFDLIPMLTSLGQLWLEGKPVDWSAFYGDEKRRRIPLPTYPFERKRFWVEPTRTALALPAFARRETEAATPASTVPRREQLVEALRQQFHKTSGLSLEDIVPSISFMELGFDSLSLAQASQSLEKKFGVKIAFRQMLEELSTINDLAAYLDENMPAEASAASPPASAPVAASATPSALEAIQAQLLALTQQMEEMRRTGAAPAASAELPAPAAIVEVPLSESEKEVWISSQDDDASRAFNQLFTVELPGRLSTQAIGELLQQLVDRHDALRTTFASDGSCQRIAATAKLDLQIQDLSGLEIAEQKSRVASVLAQEGKFVFDLASGPLFRAHLFKLSTSGCSLILNAHHIVVDGWSIGILMREFGQLYQARQDGTAATLEPTMQYSEYVQWQHSPAQQAVAEADQAYWLKRFSTIPVDIEFPSDRPRSPIKSFRAAEKKLLLDAELYAAAKKAAAAHDCTLFVILLASLKAWMYRLTGREDLVIGIPAAGQLAVTGRADARWLVGHCVSALPLRSQCPGETAFSEHLKNVKATLLDAQEHQSLTLGTLVRKLHLRSDPSRPPLIPLVFNLGRASRQLRIPDADMWFPAKDYTFFDLHFEGADSGKDILLGCRYNCDLYDGARIERMLAHFRTLLAAALAEPALKLQDLPLLTDSEKQHILVDWNRTESDFAKDRCVHELIAEHAQSTPNAEAVLLGNRKLTYSELDTQANQLARHLQKLGIGPEVPVGLSMDRTPEMIVGMLAILKAGGAYLPLDPTYPAERLAFMIEDSGIKLILTQTAIQSRLPSGKTAFLCLDSEWPTISRESSAAIASPAKPNNLAYVIYTSGSTGRPKGVLLEHRGLVNLAKVHWEQFAIGPRDRVLQFASISFDASVSEIFSALARGATICLAAPDQLLPGPEFVKLLRDQAINVVTLPPTVLNAISEDNLPALHTVISAGEACTLEMARRWGKGRRFINAYGPTEGTVCSTLQVVTPEQANLTIGRPISNFQVYILDERLRPVPIGVGGELHIGGVGLARGYHNRPELTAQKFISNPFSTDPKARLYKTGDLARYLPDGTIEYLGRLDHQVKIRGFRVELGEIEEVLNLYPGIHTNVVTAREDSPGDKRLVAYVVSKNGALNQSAMRDYLREKLPDYMVPGAFVPLPALPLTPNGKIDRKALPRPEFEAGADKSKFVEPKTPTEIALAGIWCEILGVKQVGLNDSFFDLGGHSMLAVRLIGKMRKTLDFNVSIPVFAQDPTIRNLAAIHDRQNPGALVANSSRKIESAPRLITFQAGGTRAPIFYLHGDWAGGGLYCRQLSQKLGPDQPFHALPPYQSGKNQVLSMQEMVDYHIGVIREHTPHGPYVLGGFCVGATLAVEMARQLIAQGEEVWHLLLVDPPNGNTPSLKTMWNFTNKVGDALGWSLLKKVRRYDRFAVSSVRWIRSTPQGKFQAIGRRLGLVKPDGSDPIAMGFEAGDGETNILQGLDFALYFLAACLHVVKPLNVSASVFYPEETSYSYSREKRAAELYPSPRVEFIPGTHHTCISKYSYVLAEEMRKSLEALPAQKPVAATSNV